MRRAAKVDRNQAEIVRTLRAIPGCTVQSLAALGDGAPDLLVGFRGFNFLIEIKASGGKLRPSQRKWHREWRGTVYTVWDINQAIKIITGNHLCVKPPFATT